MPKPLQLGQSVEQPTGNQGFKPSMELQTIFVVLMFLTDDLFHESGSRL